ncbi:hypothetical protein Laurelin_BL5003 [Xanthomonas phage Laurelin]|nr:hypothetical protein Laurelin_BL5003 [Xanthomonas phage Laurelin]
MTSAQVARLTLCCVVDGGHSTAFHHPVKRLFQPLLLLTCFRVTRSIARPSLWPL